MILVAKRRWVLAIAAIILAAIGSGLYWYLRSSPSPPPSEEPVAHPPLHGKKILIDVGHGGIDGGANTKDGTLEKTINLHVSLALKQAIEKRGGEVVVNRETDQDLSNLPPNDPRRYRTDLNNRIDWANQNKGDLLLSLHMNSSSSPNVRGAILLYHPQEPHTPQSKELALVLQKELNSFYSEQAKKGEVYRHQPVSGDYYVLEYTKLPSVIVEMGFITNDNDRTLFGQKNFQDAIAERIAEGVVRYFSKDPAQKTMTDELSTEEIPEILNVDSPMEPLTSTVSTNTSQGKKGKLAIIIDDFGNHASGVDRFFSINRPLTMAIMPFFEDSKELAARAYTLGFEVMVHMPMESNQVPVTWHGPRYIAKGMSHEDVKNILDDAKSIMPFAIGVNNHMGVGVSQDKTSARFTLEEIKKHQWIFVDSRTTDESVFPSLAKEVKVPFLQRNVFLDHNKDGSLEYVKQQLLEAGKMALQKGQAIAIGHVGGQGPYTAQAIQEMISPLEKMGVEFVFVSDLLNSP
ncbi:hypothetical protein GJ688_08705 [Heliobacillus mobilis]|uniref:MurNAc-LAA domain-containing protein n=1 Tax=Heliobacterium mobile TaxID=28064 RepID=A0A6I3SKJ8_HELMO|nr:divergent polysaccharide deacetylase family protein [Heliobacterium mobile]MTV49057.1 hypothetical protein [Heliobacterium mobile]